jgi:hypothetical protein
MRDHIDIKDELKGTMTTTKNVNNRNSRLISNPFNPFER